MCLMQIESVAYVHIMQTMYNCNSLVYDDFCLYTYNKIEFRFIAQPR